MRVVEWILNEDDDDQILAVSLVSSPAIEKDFQYFNKHKFLRRRDSDGKDITVVTDTQKMFNPIYGYNFWKVETRNNEPWKLKEGSHPFCIDHAKPGLNVYHITEIWSWSNQVSSNKAWQDGWINESDYTSTFKGNTSNTFNLDEQLYNCRHKLVPVIDPAQVPRIKLNRNWGLFNKQTKKDQFTMNFEVSNLEKRQIKGAAMIPDTLIYRNDMLGEYWGWFSKDTIRKFKEKYGYNRELTIQHNDNITGTAILLNSWIYNDENDDNCGIDNLKQGSWCLEYKILNDSLWNIIKMEGVKGFSVEALLSTV